MSRRLIGSVSWFIRSPARITVIFLLFQRHAEIQLPLIDVLDRLDLKRAFLARRQFDMLPIN
jgi:hypothetical protein